MSRILNLELSDSTFAAIQRQAIALGTSPADLVRALLKKEYHPPSLSQEEKLKARVRFENHFGELDVSHAAGADDECIDEDLARAYADSHEAS